MSAHTPGPWQVVDGAIGERVPVVTDADDTMVARIPPGRPNADADARLIAASPKLYAVAKRWLRLMGDAGANRCHCQTEEQYVCCRCEVVAALEAVEGTR